MIRELKIFNIFGILSVFIIDVLVINVLVKLILMIVLISVWELDVGKLKY